MRMLHLGLRVSDLLRNNLEQIKKAVRDRDHENVPVHTPPEITVERPEVQPHSRPDQA